MKLSISLDDDLAGQATARAAEVAGGNVSLLAAVGLSQIIGLPTRELSRLVELQRIDRRAPTRDAWMKAFWDVLSDEMGRPEMKTAFDNPLAVRQFGGFYVVLLLNNVARYDAENDPFIPYVGPMPVVPGSPPPYQWTYDRSASPVAAAKSVASKLQEYGVAIATPQGR